MNFKQTIFFAFIVTIIGFGFQDYCPNYKDINRFKDLFNQTSEGKVYEWNITTRCKLAIVTIDGIPLRKYMEENFPNHKNKNDEELTMLALGVN